MRSALLITAQLLIIAIVSAYDNGIKKTPPMGWNSWNLFACDINEKLLIETIDAMSSKLKQYGYEYVNIDDCWSYKEKRDDKTQRMIPDPIRFPRGIKHLADYAHSKGVKLGIYSDVGYKTCAGYPGSGDKYYEIDAQTFAEWGIDYLKLDYCNTDKAMEAAPWDYYARMSRALNSTGRPIFYSICNWGVKDPWTWAPKIANSWRTTGDIEPTWPRTLEILDQNKPLFKYSGPYTFNDPDMLEVGVVRPPNQLTPAQAKSHFSLWAMLNSPLLLGNDIRRIDDADQKWVKDILTNQDVIAISQDQLVQQAQLVYQNKTGDIDKDGNCKSESCSWVEIYARHCVGYGAVAVFNRAGRNADDKKFKNEAVTVSWEMFKLPATTELKVKELWSKSEKGSLTKQYTTDAIAPHDIRVYKMIVNKQ